MNLNKATFRTRYFEITIKRVHDSWEAYAHNLEGGPSEYQKYKTYEDAFADIQKRYRLF